MVELVGDGPGHVLESDEVDHIMIDIEVAFDLDGGPVIVAVDPLAVIAVVGDEMPGAEHQVVFGDVDFEARRWHGRSSIGK